MTHLELAIIIAISSLLFLIVAFFALIFALYKLTISRTSLIGKYVNKKLNKDISKYKIDRNWWKLQKSESISISSEKEVLQGVLIRNEKSTNKLAIVIHGYFSNHLDIMPQAKIFAENGFNVFCPDLRAHGKSAGKTIGMGYLDYFDMQLWIKKLIEIFGNEVQIVVSGWSMGAATSLMLSDFNCKNIKGIIADSAYTSAYEEFACVLKQRHFPTEPIMWLANLGAKIFGKYSLKDANPLKSVEKSDIPILFIHGTSDTFVPTFMSKKLYNAKKNGYKKLELFDEAEHILSYATDESRYKTIFVDFINILFN